MAQSRANDIEEKEEARPHKKTPQPLYEQRKQAAMPEDSRTGLAEAALNLQQTYGNRYVQRVMGGAQAKLTVGSPDDQYEREADEIADVVTGAPASAVQRQGEPKEEEEEPEVEVQTKTSLIQRQEEEVAAKPAPAIEHSAAPVLQRQTAQDIPTGVPKPPPKTTKDPKEIGTQVLKAGLKTTMGKRLIKLVFGKGMLATAGTGIVSTIAELGLSAAFAKKTGYPQAALKLVPNLVKYEVGKGLVLGFQPILKGELFKKPKEWGAMLTFTIKSRSKYW